MKTLKVITLSGCHCTKKTVAHTVGLKVKQNERIKNENFVLKWKEKKNEKFVTKEKVRFSDLLQRLKFRLELNRANILSHLCPEKKKKDLILNVGRKMHS